MPRGQTQHLAVVRETQAGSQLQGSKAPQVPLHFSDRSPANKIWFSLPTLAGETLPLVQVLSGRPKRARATLTRSTLSRVLRSHRSARRTRGSVGVSPSIPSTL